MASNTPTEESFDSKSNLGFFNNFLKLFQKEKQSQGTFAFLFSEFFNIIPKYRSRL
jgi:hypothetical protein